ncbi:MAG: response regulator transcription factor [Dehalococcoidia bacterium]|nr:response regulator transcription factor [Dehalococcoidia bacterium]
MADSTIRVLLCDDHRIVREGLKRLIETVDDIVIVGEASSGEQALELINACCPDVVLMDVRLPGMSGTAATSTIRSDHPHVHVLALSTFLDDELIFGALRAGASGYLVKDVEPEYLFNAIRLAANNDAVLSGNAASRLITRVLEDGGSAGDEAAPLSRLTPQERVIVDCLAQGLSNADIAETLVISPKTVKTHLGNIFHKLGVHNRTQAVSMYLRRPSASTTPLD